MTGQRAIQQVGPRHCGAKQITDTTPTTVLHPGSAQVIYRSSLFMPTNKALKSAVLGATPNHTHTGTGGARLKESCSSRAKSEDQGAHTHHVISWY